MNQIVPLDPHTGPEGNHHLLIVFLAADAIYTGDRGNHDYIPTLDQGCRGTVSKFIDLIIDGGILLDIGIRGGNIGLRLIIIIVGYKVFHGILREKLLHLTVELCG